MISYTTNVTTDVKKEKNTIWVIYICQDWAGIQINICTYKNATSTINNTQHKTKQNMYIYIHVVTQEEKHSFSHSLPLKIIFMNKWSTVSIQINISIHLYCSTTIHTNITFSGTFLKIVIFIRRDYMRHAYIPLTTTEHN